jgi:hypothetical protein
MRSAAEFTKEQLNLPAISVKCCQITREKLASRAIRNIWMVVVLDRRRVALFFGLSRFELIRSIRRYSQIFGGYRTRIGFAVFVQPFQPLVRTR